MWGGLRITAIFGVLRARLSLDIVGRRLLLFSPFSDRERGAGGPCVERYGTRMVGIRIGPAPDLYQFLDKLISIVLPKVKDFQGVSNTAFDQAGNYSLGLEEQIIFPEIDYDKVDAIRGMDVVICTSARTDEEARQLLKEFDMPFQN